MEFLKAHNKKFFGKSQPDSRPNDVQSGVVSLAGL
jgi:hypothetical protein